MRPGFVTVTLGLMATIIGCPGNPGSVCDAGSSQECYCTANDEGTQVCVDDGSKWGACDCGSGDDDDGPVDADGDGHDSDSDCDDSDPGVFPGATEVCTDLVDNDCDETTDCTDADCTWSPDCPQTGFVTLIAGSYLMGSPVDEVGMGQDETQHQVTLTSDFEIGVTEVTRAEMDQVFGWTPTTWDCPECPAGMISWFDAIAFSIEVSILGDLPPCYELTNILCADYQTQAGTDYLACMNGEWDSWNYHLLSGQGGIASATVSLAGNSTTPYDCEGYRLPTEAEWEYAARSAGTVEDAFPNGGELFLYDEFNCEGNLSLLDGPDLDGSAWYCGNTDGSGYNVPMPVGTLLPNPAGLHDMAGNGGEWCHDWKADYAGGETDPWGPPTGTERVYRSGSFGSPPYCVRSGWRVGVEPGWRMEDSGLRLARTVH